LKLKLESNEKILGFKSELPLLSGPSSVSSNLSNSVILGVIPSDD
jgi:hypothetical protein